MVNIIGCHDGHNSSACLLHDGVVTHAVQEERFLNIKNEPGMPRNSIEWILGEAGGQIDEVALSTRFIHAPEWYRAQGHYERSTTWNRRLNRVVWPFKRRLSPYYRNRVDERLKLLKMILQPFGLGKIPINIIEHHTAHAASAYYGSHYGPDEPVTILTADGSGDGLSATVNGPADKGIQRFEQFNSTRRESIGNIYSLTTHYLGFTPWEHEYMLMGMAPYSAPRKEILDGLNSIVRVREGRFVSEISTAFAYDYLRKLYHRQRFDWICASLQEWFERMMTGWVAQLIGKFKLPGKLACAGGDFMNVKANMAISQMEGRVEDMFVFPSAGDESTSIGAAMEAYAGWCIEHGMNPKREIKPIGPLYLGPSAVKDSPESILDKSKFECREWDAQNIPKIVGELISKGEIVARCSGRLEFGARALGNRSIMADATSLDIKTPLNKAIKQRCYDDETELLTLDGWKFFRDVRKTDIAATRNPLTDELKYQEITEVIEEDFDGELCVFETKRVSLHVTPPHQIWIKKRNSDIFEFECAENATARHSHLKGGAKWSGEEQEYFLLPSCDSKPPIRIPMDLWLEFFGYWVTEGHTHNDEEGHYITSVSQKMGTERCRVIEECMKKMPFNLSYSHNAHTNIVAMRFYNKQLYQYLHQFGKAGDKYILRNLLKLSARQLRILFSAMVVGDGDSRGRGFRYRSKSKRLSDDVQEISLKLGYSPNTSREGGRGFSKSKIYHVRITTSPVAYVDDGCISKRPYRGKVYCATVPKHHLLYVRRKGKVIVSGNSFWMPFAPSILHEARKELIDNPKDIRAPYMVMAFPSTLRGRVELKAAMHPYDFTLRPQIVEKKWNPDYWQILEEFRRRTGNGGLLNTSFNLHGYPIVHDLPMAIWTLSNSGLKYLVVENWVIEKK